MNKINVPIKEQRLPDWIRKQDPNLYSLKRHTLHLINPPGWISSAGCPEGPGLGNQGPSIIVEQPSLLSSWKNFNHTGVSKCFKDQTENILGFVGYVAIVTAAQKQLWTINK